MVVLTGFVILGGIKRIGVVAEKLVPFMCVSYVAIGIAILAVYADRIPEALALIFTHAFTPAAATGGLLGSTVWLAIRFGVARGIFSNEAGLGTAGIAEAAGTTKSAVRSGLIGMLGTFIDTIVVCSITGLAIVVTGVWTSGSSGAALSQLSFEAVMPGYGSYVLPAELAIFCTILGWAYYSEKCWGFLLGKKSEKPFLDLDAGRAAGRGGQLDFIWLVADTLNAFMAIPNLIALLLLSPVILRLTREYFAQPRKTPSSVFAPVP
jgi:AGCS family alanine or glycine:cation symporter